MTVDSELDIEQIAREHHASADAVRQLLALGVNPGDIEYIFELREVHSPLLGLPDDLAAFPKPDSVTLNRPTRGRDNISYSRLADLYRHLNGDIEAIDGFLEIIDDIRMDRFRRAPIFPGITNKLIDEQLAIPGRLVEIRDGRYSPDDDEEEDDDEEY